MTGKASLFFSVHVKRTICFVHVYWKFSLCQDCRFERYDKDAVTVCKRKVNVTKKITPRLWSPILPAESSQETPVFARRNPDNAGQPFREWGAKQIRKGDLHIESIHDMCWNHLASRIWLVWQERYPDFLSYSEKWATRDLWLSSWTSFFFYSQELYLLRLLRRNLWSFILHLRYIFFFTPQ